MSFFKPVSDIIGESCSLQVLLSMKNGKMTVTIIPKFNTNKEDIVQHITPLSVTNDPVELDRTLAVIISSSMADTKNFAENLKDYEAGLKKASKLIAPKPEKKDEDKPAEEKPESPEIVNVNTGEIHAQPEEEESPFKEAEQDMAEMPNHESPQSIEDVAGENMNVEDMVNDPKDEPETETQEEEDEEW